MENIKIGTFVEYKGHVGTIEYGDDIYHGKLIGINGLVNYKSKSIDSLFDEYKKAVDDYINFLDELDVRNDIDNTVNGLISRIFDNLHLIGALNENRITITELKTYIEMCSHLRHTTFVSQYGIKHSGTTTPQIKLMNEIFRLETDMRKLHALMISFDIKSLTK